ncbi:hypothetical protein BO78DRAFT_41834 [Aspergillus sclerotiicarbonarius CBS 121057]|uniref:Uncharacterized protein n=1 Tax=Aspergillus sclerotiicarbonarius (strain CBS 121057 / IBT 28362) TaxID=1448318 RepID=A0A319DS01_ASPSB|nr:hypothetical protein BO78DRAFT_41834 [Aspergillus sclerotiicarbonarius CBS 121057]
MFHVCCMRIMMMTSLLSVVISMSHVLGSCPLKKCYMCVEVNGFFKGFYLTFIFSYFSNIGF